jgi:FkbH-like protein
MSHPDGVDLQSLALDEILMKRKGLRRKLAAREFLRPIRIAVLGGSTTNEVVDLLELRLLANGFAPVFYQSEYGRYAVEPVHDPEKLVQFHPDVVYLHTSYRDIQDFAPLQASEAELGAAVQREFERYQAIWAAIGERLGCQVIQNNFEFPPQQILGNLDATCAGGHTRFILQLNLEFARAAAKDSRLSIQDVCSLSARVGLERWFDWERYFSYKVLTTPEGSYALAISLSAMIGGMYGKARKVLVLDLDNTLWGGVIGDDGVDRILIGRETPVAEAYTAFQEYCLALRNRGVLLAVCSKNDEAVARSGFEHPDSVLKLEHISCFKANWEPKSENIAAIARELNLGTDSFVFVDDNPAERAIVEGQVEGIAVPNIGNDVAHFPGIIEASRYFEQSSFSAEDLERAALYQANSQRAAFETKFADYGSYLDSLEMVAEIEPFNRLYLDRITQLTNKTNQFNLTTRRYSIAEMEEVLKDRDALGLYGRLSDRFGDHGLVSVVLGRREGDGLTIDLWLMSCRVLKRDMELAMLDALVERAQALGVRTIRGVYVPTKKNGMVADHYSRLGFERERTDADGHASFTLELGGYSRRGRHIRMMELVHGQ